MRSIYKFLLLSAIVAVALAIVVVRVLIPSENLNVRKQVANQTNTKVMHQGVLYSASTTEELADWWNSHHMSIVQDSTFVLDSPSIGQSEVNLKIVDTGSGLSILECAVYERINADCDWRLVFYAKTFSDDLKGEQTETGVRLSSQYPAFVWEVPLTKLLEVGQAPLY